MIDWFESIGFDEHRPDDRARDGILIQSRYIGNLLLLVIN
jgi:hypothetical protein